MSSSRTWLLAFLTLLAFFGSVAVAAARECDAREPVETKREDVSSAVESRTTILHIKPAGAPVRKGELVCLLDPSTLQNRLANQSLILLGARAACENARLTREEAELAVTDYVETIFKQEFETIKDEVALAQADLKRAEDRLEWSKRMFERGRLPDSRRRSERFSLDQKTFALEQAQTRMKVLEMYTRDKTTKALQARVEKARLEESARQAAYAHEQAVERRLKAQVENCMISSPADGRIIYPESSKRGSIVREGQLLFRVISEDERKDRVK